MGSQPCSIVRLVDEILNIISYMENFFHTQERLSAARKEANSFEDGSDATSSFSSASAAQSWIRRVEAGISNLRRDLETDSLDGYCIPLGSINLSEHWGDHLYVVQKMSCCVVRRYYRYFNSPSHPDACNGKSQRAVAGAGPSGV